MNLDIAKSIIISTFCSFALVGGAVAQTKDQPKDQMKDQQKASEKKVTPPVAGLVPLALTIEETHLIAAGWRASRLNKADVYNDKAEKIGTVDDLIIATDGSVSAAVIEVGGFLGLTAHKVLVPVSRFTHVDPKRLILPGANKDESKKLPKFKYV